MTASTGRGRRLGLATLIVTALVTGATACRKRAKEIAGIGPWSVTRTTLASATGRCEPTDLPDGRKGTWCYGQQPLRIAGSPAEVDLYFAGDDPKATPIEIQLTVRGCKETPTFDWLRQVFGPPASTTGPWAYWDNAYIFLAAGMPSAPGRCTLRILPRREQAEFERIRAGHTTPPG